MLSCYRNIFVVACSLFCAVSWHAHGRQPPVYTRENTPHPSQHLEPQHTSTHHHHTAVCGAGVSCRSVTSSACGVRRSKQTNGSTPKAQGGKARCAVPFLPFIGRVPHPILFVDWASAHQHHQREHHQHISTARTNPAVSEYTTRTHTHTGDSNPSRNSAAHEEMACAPAVNILLHKDMGVHMYSVCVCP